VISYQVEVPTPIASEWPTMGLECRRLCYVRNGMSRDFVKK